MEGVVVDTFPGEFEAALAPSVAVTTVALVALGRRQSNPSLMRWGGAMTVSVLAGWGLEHSRLQLGSGSVLPYDVLVWQVTFLAATIGGLVSYRRETQADLG